MTLRESCRQEAKGWKTEQLLKRVREAKNADAREKRNWSGVHREMNEAAVMELCDRKAN